MPYSCRYNKHLRTLPYPYFLIVHSTTESTVGPTLHAFEQFGALYMHNDDDTYPVRDSNLVPPGYNPQSLRMSHFI